MTTTAEARLDFEARRRLGIGGSDAGAIVGMSPYDSALDIYNQKLGLVPSKPQTPQMLRGRYLEPVAVEIYCELTGRKVRRQPQRTHPDYPFIIGNIDRQILANGESHGDVLEPLAAEYTSTGLLEVKCPGVRTFLRYQREGLPAHIIAQGQHYMGVYDYAWMSFVIFNSDLWRLVHFEVKRDDGFIAGLYEAEIRFWREHVEKKVPPPEGGMLHATLPELDLPEVAAGEIVQRDDPEYAEAAENLLTARTLVETAEAVEETAIARVKEIVGKLGVYEGANLRLYWKQQAGKKSFDRKALEAAKPLDRMRVFSALAEISKEWEPRYLAALSESLGDCTVDFSVYDKVGKPFETFRPYFLKPQGPDDE